MNKKNDIKNIALHESLMWDRHDYYDQAEHFLKNDWKTHIWPIIKNANFSSVVDLAAGHGRNSVHLINLAKKLYIVDIHQSNINFCKIRFRKHCNVEYILCDGISCNGVLNNTVTLVYCFDAMVHFDSDVIRNYLKDINRILMHGGTAFLHHSNYDKNPGGWFQNNPHARNFMTSQLLQHYAIKEGLRVISSNVIDWGHGENHVENIDCITYLVKD